MSLAGIFAVVNVLPLPVWAIWMIAPRSAAARYLAGSVWPWIALGLIYTVGMVLLLVQGGAEGGSFGTLEGVMALFDSPLATLVGWVHFLCFDLFVGRWIMNDAPNGGYRLAPVLLLTLMFGPAGLLAYLAGRDFFRGA